jgi:hypothetical protein
LRNVKKLSTWVEISTHFKDKNSKQCSYRYKKISSGKDKTKWSREDDMKLAELVEYFGEKFDLMKPYFTGKSEIDIQTRYYKKINHKNINFSAEEDQVILKLYKKLPLTNTERKIIKIKGAFSIKKRLEILLKLKGEELDKSFNISSCLSSSISSVHNSNALKMDEEQDIIQPFKIKSDFTNSNIFQNNTNQSSISKDTSQVTAERNSIKFNQTKQEKKKDEKEILNKSANNTNKAKNTSYLAGGQLFQNASLNSNLKSSSKYNNLSNDIIRMNQMHDNIYELDDHEKSIHTLSIIDQENNISSKTLNNSNHDSFNNNIYSSNNKDTLRTPNDYESFNNRFNEPEDNFENSFNGVFNMNNSNIIKNEFFYDFNTDLNFDQVLNQYSNTNIEELVEKNKNLEQVLNEIHGISESFNKDFQDKVVVSACSESDKKRFLNMYCKLTKQEIKLIFDLDQQKKIFKAYNVITPINKSEAEIIKELSLRIEYLMKLIEVIKTKVLLSKRLVQSSEDKHIRDSTDINHTNEDKMKNN